MVINKVLDFAKDTNVTDGAEILGHLDAWVVQNLLNIFVVTVSLIWSQVQDCAYWLSQSNDRFLHFN